MFPVLIYNSRVYCQKLTSLILLIMLNIPINTLNLSFLSQHACPCHTHDALLTHLVFVSFTPCHEPVATLPGISEWFRPFAEVSQWFLVVVVHHALVFCVIGGWVNVCLLEYVFIFVFGEETFIVRCDSGF